MELQDPRIERLESSLSSQFADNNVDFVPDPMVLRAAELFILGKAGRTVALPDSDPEDAWTIIDRNLDGVLAFFHVFMTRDRIPLIDYEYTFPDFGIGELLDDAAAYIHPDLENYEFIAQEAARRVARFDLDLLDPRLLRDVANELGLSGYEWFPAEAQYQDLPTEQRVAATFVTGGIIFGGYAQAAGVDHLLQSKRSRLFAQLAVAETDRSLWAYEREEELFAKLRRSADDDQGFDTHDYTLPPSVLTMLMFDRDPPTSPAELFEKTRELRESDLGAAYRQWHTELRGAWARGEPHDEADAVVEQVAVELERRFGRTPTGPLSGVNLEAHDAPAAAPGPSTRLRNWFVERVRLRGHRKLLLRMSLPQVTLEELTGRLRHIWETS